MIEGLKNDNKQRKLTYGMVGGGPGAFIGDVHRKAINLDGLASIAAGCFSRDKEKTLETGRALGIAEDRLYASYDEMAKKESQREDCIDFAVVVTPNATHYGAVKALLSHGIAVVCDKPFTFNTEEAAELTALAKRKNLLLAVTYTYTGYPAVKHARELVASGDIGEIRFVNAEYPQEWLATATESDENKQAAWRLDPSQSGKTNCTGDIGSHVENLVSYITGLRIKKLAARLDKIVEGRKLDDNSTIMVEYEGGAKGLYWASQIAIGFDNALRIRIFGSKGTIQWSQEDPNYLTVSYLDKPTMRLSRGRDAFASHAQSYSRIPSGHPEGYFEAFANIYKTYITALMKQKNGEKLTPEDLDFPTGDMGVDGVKFINACVESSDKDSTWIKF
ncbi:Gfo/Idh/MocA family protein [Pleomorphochaeta sp. DL1XJH-081]|uniref:Gfo/Idh/MocA family protein n=1 Tax=Pleomorphochaeta sp. DL1XJH-081 TaxID=3409690 RepID=UPI003BB7A4FB